MTTDTGWSRPFDDAITLPDGRTLVTLGDAGRYIAGLPSKVQHRPEWQNAAEALLPVAERGGPTMPGRIGFMPALNAGKAWYQNLTVQGSCRNRPLDPMNFTYSVAIGDPSVMRDQVRVGANIKANTRRPARHRIQAGVGN